MCVIVNQCRLKAETVFGLKCKTRTITDSFQMVKARWNDPCLSLPDTKSHDFCVSLLDTGGDEQEARYTQDHEMSPEIKQL